MTLTLSMPGQEELKPRITVFGVGGAGGNAVNNMIEKNLEGVDFVVANTDAQALQQSRAQNRVQLGVKVTEGLGAGARPQIGARAAEESIEQIVDHLVGTHMCFITAGMGGGTGTGAAPIIAQAARELGVLTVGVVTKPFQFEGAKRMRQAEEGVEALQKVVDTLIIIPNQNLFRLANEKTTFTEAFAMADDVLYQGVKGVTDLMVKPGLINLDFADVRAVMDEMGKAMMGTGEAEGEDRAVQAAEKAIANPLLDEISLKGARGVLINITGSHDLTLFELDEAANRIREEVDPEANIIVGSTLDPDMQGIMRVSVVATGIDVSQEQVAPVERRPLDKPLRPPAADATCEDPLELRDPQEPAGIEPQTHSGEAAVSEQFDDIFDEEEAAALEKALDDAGDLPPPLYNPGAGDNAGSLRERAFGDGEGAAEDAGMHQRRRGADAGGDLPPNPGTTERSRFGINRLGLIGRMAGRVSQSSDPAPALRSTPPLHSDDAGAPDPATDPEQERIEIPAFLRRQAN